VSGSAPDAGAGWRQAATPMSDAVRKTSSVRTDRRMVTFQLDVIDSRLRMTPMI
jgi:hypothetical protein